MMENPELEEAVEKVEWRIRTTNTRPPDELVWFVRDQLGLLGPNSRLQPADWENVVTHFADVACITEADYKEPRVLARAIIDRHPEDPFGDDDSCDDWE